MRLSHVTLVSKQKALQYTQSSICTTVLVCFLVAGIKCKDTLVIFAAKAFGGFFPLSKNHTASSKFTLE